MVSAPDLENMFMFTITRITTRYIDANDRLRLTCQVEGGGAVVLWLTQRLMLRALPHLTGWLENQPSVRVATAAPALQRDAVQAFAQQVARAQLPQAPVERDGSSREWLVSSVDLARGGKTMRLIFKSDTGDAVAGLSMSAGDLRGWLNIVFDQWTKAEWPQHIWPNWMKPASLSSPAAQKH